MSYDAGTGGGRHGVQVTSARSDADRLGFREISQAWIQQYFTLTDADRALLDDPEAAIVTPGGDVLVARIDGSDEVVGCIALVACPDAVMELSKMGVRPAAHGHGVGRALVAAALERARELGARRVFLGTNTVLAPARHLYEAAGFTRITREQLPVEDYYARADILMQIEL